MNVKAGDLAICLTGYATPEMAGKIVRVIRIAVDGEKVNGIPFLMNGAIAWIVEGNNLPLRLSNGDFLHVKKRCYEDRLLRPISGIPDSESESQDNYLEVKA